MKKSLILTLILGLVVIMAVPASAFRIEGAKDTKFYFGALVYTDLGVWSRDKELVPGGKSERTEGILNVPRHSRVRGVIESGSVGAYWEIRLGGDQQLAGASGFSSSGYYFAEGAKLYGYYKFGNCTLLAGKTDGHFFSVTPYQNLGFDNDNHIAGFGWGAVYDHRDAQVRFSQDVSKTFGYDISFVQSTYYMDNGTPALGTGAGAIQSIMQWPTTAVKLRMNFGMVSLMPAGVVQYVKWNDLPNTPNGSNPADNMTAWAAVLPVVVKAGAFTGTFQGLYGQNLGSYGGAAGNRSVGGLLAFQNTFHSYRRDLNGSIKNTTGLAGFVDLAFTAGAVTPHFFVGYDKAENTDAYVDDKNNTSMMYGVAVNWKITDNFYVVPEFALYDYGKDPTKKGNPDLGSEWLGGVQFQFVF